MTSLRRSDSDRFRALGTDHPPAHLSLAGAVDRGEFRLEVEVRVPPGEVLGVLGPNGAGKSTLLRSLAGLVPLTEGRLVLGDRVLDDAQSDVFVPTERRPVGLVFQDYRLFPHLPVLDNVAFAARSRGASRRRSREMAAPWLERLAIDELATRRPHEISGGQAQRVALARALAADPELLLLDEPLAAMDARTRLDVRTALRRHLEQFAGPVVLVTHDPLEAMVLADRLVVIEHGRVVQTGSPTEVARRPATDYVARLLGLNLYAGSRDGASGAVALDGGGSLVATFEDVDAAGVDERGSGAPSGGGGAPLSAPAGGQESGRPAPDRVLVAVRPSAITLHTRRPDHASPRNVWEGTIAGLELLADRVRVQVDGAPPALVDITPAAVAELRLAPGERVWLSAKATETEAYPDAAAG